VQRAAEIHASIPRAPRIAERPAANPAAEDVRLPDEDETLPSAWRPFSSSRVREAGYSKDGQRLYVRFVKPDGSVVYVYEGVPSNVWRNFSRSASPGKYINRVLNGFDYHRFQGDT
jgi:hypothetical protein